MTTNYGYDAIYQLLSATQGATTTESYSYDPAGNRTASLGVSSYTTNSSNELTAMTGTSFTYDNNGNELTKVVASNTTTYAWDFENRMTSVTLPAGAGTVSFAYDPFGRRIKKVTSSGTSIFAYDGDNLIEETNSSGTVVARYSQGLNIDGPLAMLRSSATSYFNADGLGTITSLANTTGALAQTYTFDSFGKQTASSGSLTNPFQYTAREWDTETGLYYYRARYYNPAVGRFISEDPSGFGGGDVNLYAYVANNPIDRIDPSGLTWQTNQNYFWDWVLGGSFPNRNYDPNSVETQEMKNSIAGQFMRDQFIKNGCRTLGVSYGTFQAYWDTLANPFTADWSDTSFEVGGFAGPSGVTNNGNGTATFNIYNTSGTHSFFLHLVPDRTSPNGPMSNINQHFHWTEPIPNGKCGCK